MPDINSGYKKDLFSLTLLMVLILVSYLPPLLNLDRTLNSDWRYFNSLNLVVRSNILHYQEFPMHDPWAAGGLDLLANPQNRIFTPELLLDIFLPPNTANWISIIIYALLGAIASFYFFRYFQLSRFMAAAGALLFLNSSWFALHFAEGHITFRSFQLIPLLFLLFFELEKKRNQFFLAILFSFLVLNGGLYIVFYSLLFLVVYWIIYRDKYRIFKKQVRGNPLWFWGLSSLFILLSSPKIYPVLVVLHGKRPRHTFNNLPFTYMWDVLFNPFQSRFAKGFSEFDFHEFGCYIGLLSFAILIIALFNTSYRKENKGLLLLTLIFFWISSGWLSYLNPWRIYQLIPYFKHAHLQSRLFIFVHLFFIVLILRYIAAHAFRKKYMAIILCLLVCESFFVKFHVYFKTYERDSQKVLTNKLIDSDNILRTIPFGYKPMHYYDRNTGSAEVYEPGLPRQRKILHEGMQGYKGEIYFIKGSGKVVMESYTPGRIKISYEAEKDSAVEINTNYLAGWKVEQGKAIIKKQDTGRLSFVPLENSGTLVLRYAPFYMTAMFISFCMGFLLVLFFAYRLFIHERREKTV